MKTKTFVCILLFLCRAESRAYTAMYAVTAWLLKSKWPTLVLSLFPSLAGRRRGVCGAKREFQSQR